MEYKASSKKYASAFYDGIPPKIIRPSPVRTYHKSEITRNAKVKFTRDGLCKVTCFSRPVYHLEGFEVNERSERAFILQEADKPPAEKSEGERKRSDSLKRAKDKIFEIVSCNDWSYMVTFTLDKSKIDRYNPEEVQKRFSSWLYNCAKRKGLIALVVPELHADGAIHFHGLINNALIMTFSGTYKVKGDKHPIKLQTLRRRGKSPKDDDVKEVYNVSDYNLGFSTAVKLTGNGFDEAYEELAESVSRVAYYMTKYCTKDLDKIFGSYYIAVGKLQREMPYVICNLDIEAFRGCGRFFNLPEGLGEVCYATITKDDFEGVMLQNERG